MIYSHAPKRHSITNGVGVVNPFPSWIVALQLTLAIFGYPLVGIVGSLVSPDSGTAAIVFRGFVVLLSISMTIFALRQGQGNGRLDGVLMMLLTIYSLRLLIDSVRGGFPETGWDATQFFGFTVTPLVGLLMLSNYRETHRETLLAFLVGTFATCLFAVLAIGGVSALAMATDDFQGRAALARLNPIAVGHMAASTIIAAIAISENCRKTLLIRLGVLLVICAGFYCLYIAGSRGPLLSFGMAFLAFLIVRGRWKSVVGVVVISICLTIWSSSSDGNFLDRLQEIGSDQSSLGRLDLQQLAFSEFLDSPIIGSAHVETLTGGYPHNIVLDAAMSTGLIGLGLLLWVLVRVGIACARLLRGGEVLLPLLAIQYTIAAQFSGSMFSSPEFWTCAALTLAVAQRRSAVTTVVGDRPGAGQPAGKGAPLPTAG